MWDAGQVGCRTGQMREMRDAEKMRCRKGGNLDIRGTGKGLLGTGEIQDWMDKGNEGCRKEESRIVGLLHRCWTEGIQGCWDAGQMGCRTG